MVEKHFVNCFVMIVVFCLSWVAISEEDSKISRWSVLSGYDEISSPREMMKSYLNKKALKILEEFQKRDDYIPSTESFDDWKQKRREELWKLIGGMPEKTPLNSSVVRKGEKPTFRYEVLYFESMPGLYVSAVLFLPLTPPPYPAMIIPCGHSQEAKGYVEYQKMCILLAQNGVASLIYDPPGQGERITFIDDSGKPIIWGTAEHTVVGFRCILMGMNYALFEIWDGIRAIDYLMTREDIDRTKIGCAGNSGGGTQTAYLMSLDERIKFAGPSCYITSWEKLLNTIGPQDAEQNIYSQILYGFDHSDYLMLHAPKPFLLCCATYDFFDIQGTWFSYRRAKRLYSALGFNSNCDIIEVGRKHGWCREMREEIVKWALLHFLGKRVDVKEDIKDSDVLVPDEYKVTGSGNVREIPGSLSIPEILVRKFNEVKGERDDRWAKLSRDEREKIILKLLDIRDVEHILEPAVQEVGEDYSRDFDLQGLKTVKKFVVIPEDGIFLPVIIFEPEKQMSRLVLISSSSGKESIDIEKIQNYLSDGNIVVTVDMRGVGETECKGSKNDITNTSGNGWEDYFRAYLIGESFVAMWTRDYFSLVKFLEKQFGGEIEIVVEADEKLSIPALHFAYLVNSPRISLRLEKVYYWEDFIYNPRIRGQIMSAVNGVLIWYDIPHLISDLEKDKVVYSRIELPMF